MHDNHGLSCFSRHPLFSKNIHCCGLRPQSPPKLLPEDHSTHSNQQVFGSPDEPTGQAFVSATLPDTTEMERAPTPGMEPFTLIRTRSNHCRRAKKEASTSELNAAAKEETLGHDHDTAQGGMNIGARFSSDHPTGVHHHPQSNGEVIDGDGPMDRAAWNGNPVPNITAVADHEEGAMEVNRLPLPSITAMHTLDPKYLSSHAQRQQLAEASTSMKSYLQNRQKRCNNRAAALQQVSESKPRWKRLKAKTENLFRKISTSRP